MGHHTTFQCPLSKLQYCGICCCYGHLQQQCPNEEAKQHREVEYVEQLVPPALLHTYGIKTLTPVSSTVLPKKKANPIMEVVNSEKEIRQILINHGLTPLGKMNANRKLLNQIAVQEGKTIVYLSPE